MAVNCHYCATYLFLLSSCGLLISTHGGSLDPLNFVGDPHKDLDLYDAAARRGDRDTYYPDDYEEESSEEEEGTEKDDYFLPEDALEEQVLSLHHFLSSQMALSPNKSGTAKINTTALGFPNFYAFRQVFSGFGDTVKRDAVCSGCQVFMGVLNHQIKVHKSSESSLLKFSTFTCTYFKLAHPDVCNGIFERLGPSFYYIVSVRPKMKPAIMCGLLFQSLGCRIPQRSLLGTDFEWNVDTLRKPGHDAQNGMPRPPVSVPISHDYRNPIGLTKDPDRRVMKIAHLADLHIDYDYLEGTKADCENEVLCCQEKHGYPDPKDNSTGAGHFGDNRKCDAPVGILHMALNHIKSHHGGDIDMIYMTGDLVPHNIWYSTKEHNTATIVGASKVILDYFPNATIIPCLGNHEPHPVNLFSPTSRIYGSPEANPIPEELRTDWVYEAAYKSWSSWIPPDQQDSFLRAGYFAVEINPKFRVLVVNTNVCYGFNIWQLYDPQDPGGQLEWLQRQLELTAENNQTVHIVGHVPPGHEDCFKTWSREFYKIVTKHRSVIRGQFYGHTHYDEFRILHDPLVKTDPINVMWIGPSLTPYRIYNPGYRVYHVDLGYEGTYGDVIDHDTYIYDLDKSNAEYAKGNISARFEDVKWFQLYRATEQYGLKNLLPRNLASLVMRMARHKGTFNTFYRNYFKAIDPEEKLKDQCDTVCRKRILCGMVQPYYDDDDGHVECDTVQKEMDGIVLPLRVLEHRKRFIWL